jgi:hypothetical protein
MAICVIDTDGDGNVTPGSVSHIERIALQGSTISQLVKSLKGELDARSHHWGTATVFVIEQQPSSNIRMKVISHCIEMYIHATQPSAVVSFSSAKAALDRVTLSMGGIAVKKMPYQARKRKSVELATRLLMHSPMADAFTAQKKKDDCADALMHGVSWVLRSGGSLQMPTGESGLLV